MIDIAYEVQKFSPVDISAIPADEKYSENVRLAFALYNKAIQKINKGYEDLARIDLKKAVQLYPNFYVAIILLGMCTFANGDRIGAVRIFNSVKDQDMREKALNYLDYLAGEMDRITNTNIEHKPIREEEMFSVKLQGSSTVNKSFDKFEVIEVDDTIDNLTLKIELQDEIETKVIIKEPESKPAPEFKPEPKPAVKETKKEEKKPEKKEDTKEEKKEEKKAEKKEEHREEKKEPEKTRESKTTSYVKKADEPAPQKKVRKETRKLTYVGYVVLLAVIMVMGISLLNIMSENNDLKDALLLYTNKNNDPKPTPTPTEPVSTNTPTQAPITPTPIDYYALTAAQVQDCFRNYNFRQYYAVVEIYHTIKMEYVPEAQKSQLNQIYNTSLRTFSRQNYDIHFSYTNEKRYEEVLELLLPILKYNPNFENTAAVCFYVGKAYEELKNTTKAKEYYNIVIDKYPGTDYANWAAYRLIVIG